MRSAWLVAVCGVGGCWGETAIEVTLQPPAAAVAAEFDTSCVRGVMVYLNGASYPAVDDSVYDCVDVEPAGATFADVRDRIRGKLSTKLPASGLSGVEVYGFAARCDAAVDKREYDLLFYGSAPHIGGDELTVPLIPNLSCAPRDVTIRPIDLLKLVTGGCAAAAWNTGKLSLATLSPLPFTDRTYWWGGAPVNIVGGVAAVRGNTKVGPRSCLAVGLNEDNAWVAVTCVPRDEDRVCATGGELEAPMIAYPVWDDSIDDSIYNEHGSLVIGAVYGTAPIQGAQVTVAAKDAALAEVVYFDLPPGVENGVGALVSRGGSSTGPSGLFGVYTMSMIEISITANGRTITRTLAGSPEGATAVVIKM